MTLVLCTQANNENNFKQESHTTFNEIKNSIANTLKKSGFNNHDTSSSKYEDLRNKTAFKKDDYFFIMGGTFDTTNEIASVMPRNGHYLMASKDGYPQFFLSKSGEHAAQVTMFPHSSLPCTSIPRLILENLLEDLSLINDPAITTDINLINKEKFNIGSVNAQMATSFHDIKALSLEDKYILSTKHLMVYYKPLSNQ